MSLVQEIDAVLPQTQCGLCGYAGCRPYAEALATGVVAIDHCPPGGVKTLHALGALLQIDPKPYEAAMVAQTRPPALAVIREAECIGCTKCIQACPVDAIVGAAKLMHTVLVHECTGCGLCVEPCPVDCIDMLEVPALDYDPDAARARYQARQVRLVADENAKVQHYRNKRRLSAEQTDDTAEKAAKKDYILAALARVKAK
ncbi:MAG: RnfABCDGE type electron transport complex subunit B [Legionellales bacterium]|nr:RnfABCDGE type electron transport complex subunit B [Legionellales bacterium]